MIPSPSMELRRLWLGGFSDTTGQAPRMTPDGKRRTAPQILYDGIDFESADDVTRFIGALRDQAAFCDSLAASDTLPGAARVYAAARARTIRQQLAAESY